MTNLGAGCEKRLAFLMPSSHRYPPSLLTCPYTQRPPPEAGKHRSSRARTARAPLLGAPLHSGAPSCQPAGTPAPPLLSCAPEAARGRTVPCKLSPLRGDVMQRRERVRASVAPRPNRRCSFTLGASGMGDPQRTTENKKKISKFIVCSTSPSRSHGRCAPVWCNTLTLQEFCSGTSLYL